MERSRLCGSRRRRLPRSTRRLAGGLSNWRFPGRSFARRLRPSDCFGLAFDRPLRPLRCRCFLGRRLSGRERTIEPHSPSRVSLPRKGRRVGLHIVLFEACSAFTRVAACTLALSPLRDTLPEGFSHFVTSMTAPVASGWSDARVGLAPTGKRRLITAHTRFGLWHSASCAGC